MTSDELIRSLHTELLDLFRTFKPPIADKWPRDPQMVELINRVGGACGKIVDYWRENGKLDRPA